MPRRAAKNSVEYSVHPAIAHAQSIIRNLQDKTGRSFEEWVDLVQRSGIRGEKEGRNWLKQEYGLGGTTAAMVAARAEGKGAEDTDPDAYLQAAVGYVDGMYAGPKAKLREIHDALICLALSVGPDVKISPCRTIVPLYRDHVFAEIKPATRTRIDLGLALRHLKRKPVKRLIETGGLAKGDRITHRFAIASSEDVDEQVERWLCIAYELAS
jgi:hypothetical protein